jgi:catechol 2,3-dioxygenase-like lactoylglutathione lyase family enzyme
MLDHIEIYVSDLERSIDFWTPLLTRLGYEPDRWSDGINYRRAQQPYLSFLTAPSEHIAAGYHRQRIGLNHLAFRAESRAQVDKIAKWAKSAGYSVLYEDRFPFATGPGYYAMFCEDPDRIKVEVVAPHDA